MKNVEKNVGIMHNKAKILKDYPRLFLEIKERIRSAQYEALKAVNKELVGLYWDIGKMIVSKQYEQHYGKSVVEQLASDLQKEFPGIAGFSVGNLWRMRAFFENYSDSRKLAPLVRELAWSHNVVMKKHSSIDCVIIFTDQRNSLLR